MGGVLSLMGSGSTDLKCLGNREYRDNDENLHEVLRIMVELYII